MTAHRRGTTVDASVLGATLDLLAEQGYAFSVDDVAARAGVHKTTVYRRWETKPLLVAAAVQQLAGATVEAHRTADPIDDLRQLAHQVAAGLRSPAGRNALRATMAAAGSDPELAAVAQSFFRSRYAVAAPLIAEAQDQGRLRADVDPTLLWQAVVNPLHLNAVCGVDPSAAEVDVLLDLVLHGAAVT